MTQAFAKGEFAGVRALVVDDEPDLAETLSAFLDLCGMDVRTAPSGNEGFAVFSSYRPDIIVSDIGMANGTGLDLIRQVRSLSEEEGGLTPAIAMSGAAAREECFEAGFHFYLPKPFEPLALIDIIRDFVRAERPGRATWTVTALPNKDVVIRFDGYVTAADMRGAVSELVKVLARSSGGDRVIVDLRRLSGFDPSVGAVAESVVWRLRKRIRGAQIVGGTGLSHLVARGACLVLGIPCEVVP